VRIEPRTLQAEQAALARMTEAELTKGGRV